MRIYLDIETIPSQRNYVRDRIWSAVEPPKNYTKPESREKWLAEHRNEVADKAWRETALDGGYGEVVCVCFAVEDGVVNVHDRPAMYNSERELLSAVFESIRLTVGGQSPTYVGHCIGFDLKFLHHRAIVCGVNPRLGMPYNAPPWRGMYIDTMYEWCGARGGIKLVELCDVLGIEVDDEIDGAGVWDAWRDGDYAKVSEHCRADVLRVREIERRLRWAE